MITVTELLYIYAALIFRKILFHYAFLCRSHLPSGLRRGSAVARLLRLWARIPPQAWKSDRCECCVLSGRGFCDELITRPEESYRLWCVIVCDLETSWRWRPWPTKGLLRQIKEEKEKKRMSFYSLLFQESLSIDKWSFPKSLFPNTCHLKCCFSATNRWCDTWNLQHCKLLTTLEIYIYSPTRFTMWFHWVSFYWALRFQLYIFRTSWVHLQELLCKYCICRLWHVVIRVLPGTSSWYKVDTRTLQRQVQHWRYRVTKLDRRCITMIKDFSFYRRFHSWNLKMCHVCCPTHGVNQNDQIYYILGYDAL